MTRSAGLVAGVVIIALSSVARADQRTSFYSDQLRTNDDYRVRTQAALALGASGDDAAVAPLCKALADDGNVSVRVAAAAALGKLRKDSAQGCLQGAQGRESSSSVKAQIDRSLAAIQNSSTPPPPGPDTKYYVAITITNKTSRPASEIETLVRGAMQSKLLAKSGYAVAPKGQSPSQGGQIVKEKKLKGFLLMATVESPSYSGGNLTQVVRVSILSYPGKDLKGSSSPKLVQEGTPNGDTQSENVLIRMCSENAIDNFQKVVSAL